MQDVIKKCRFKDSGVIINAPADIETEFHLMVGVLTGHQQHKAYHLFSR